MNTSQGDGTPPSIPASGGDSGPLVSQRAATIGTAAAVIGGVVGSLTYIEAGNLAGAAIASLMTFGASVLGLHKVIGN